MGSGFTTQEVMMGIQTLAFDEFVDLLRVRLFQADALDRSKLHDFKELMSDCANVTPEGWYDDAFEELQAQGHLHQASGATFGGPFGRLSADGRLHVRENEDLDG
jgi:hypothetical protein